MIVMDSTPVQHSRKYLLSLWLFIYKDHVVQLLLTMITSMGMGTGSLDLNLSFSSFTMNTTTMINKEITTSHTLVEVILLKMISRVWKKIFKKRKSQF